MTLWAIVPAAGEGLRMGGELPKQYVLAAGKPLLQWSVESLLRCERLAGCMVALAPGDRRGLSLPIFSDARVRSCEGGASRAESVAAGLAALAANDSDWVLVHDAARPCLPLVALNALIERVLDTEIGGLLAQPQSDTLKRADGDGRVLETLPREGVWRAQTPQMFRAGELANALAAAQTDAVDVTDEASAMERQGLPVQVVAGPSCNLKVTYADDLAIAAQWLAEAS